MPLHLLGKKSWNVYNPDNIERVKRDEARAKASEEEAERRTQEVDAERRIRILRGERLSPPPPPTSPSQPRPGQRSKLGPHGRYADSAGQPRKRRRLAGEDDTDRDIRLAKERAAEARDAEDRLAIVSHGAGTDAEAPLLDKTGHINLFPAETGVQKTEKNPEAEAEAADKRKRFEDQYTMRFSNAAGFKEQVGRRPWYSSASQAAVAPDSISGKDVWGNEDPRRKEREKARLSSNDPLAAMKRGVRQLRATEQERKRWREEKQAELQAFDTEERRQARHRRDRLARSEGTLDGFSLDAPAERSSASREKDRSRRHHHDRHRHKSRDSLHRRRHHSSDRSRHTEGSHRHHKSESSRVVSRDNI